MSMLLIMIYVIGGDGSKVFGVVETVVDILKSKAAAATVVIDALTVETDVPKVQLLVVVRCLLLLVRLVLVAWLFLLLGL